MVNILMIGLPFTGHINPSLGLSKAFIDNGHNVSFVLTKDWKDAIDKTGAQFVPYNNFPATPTQFELRRLSFKSAYDTALSIGKNFDIVIYDVLFFVGKNLADKLNLPAIRLFSTFALDNDILNRIVNTGGPLMGLLKSKVIRKAITEKLVGEITLKKDDLLAEIIQNSPVLNFIFTTREFQIGEKNFPDSNFKFIGPSIIARDEQVSISLESLANPLIYISLGTMLNNAKHFYNRCIKAFKNENVSVIMSVGEKVNIDDFEEIPSNFTIYPFVPQLQVLGKANLFITHGGMNSVNEALYYGVPMIVMPLATDQPTVAKRIEELNLGRQLPSKSPSAKEIRETASKVLDDKNILTNVKNLQTLTRQAKGTAFAVRETVKFMQQHHGNIYEGGKHYGK